ncbi:MAG: hypothetical protein ACREOM_15200 [Candidatus Dormibacteraceae bacterium]
MRPRLLGAAAAALIAISLTAAAVIPPNRGIVSGGIRPCSALDNPNLEHYAGGTVTVLEGQVKWRSVPGTSDTADVLPSRAVARENVPTNGLFRFELDPGVYVLEAAPPGDFGAYTTASVGAGDDLLVDIPNGCI